MVSPSRNRRLMTTTVAALVPLLLSCCSFIHGVSANFFAEPTPKWSVQLQGSGRRTGRGLQKGNAIVSDKDGTKIVVTANDGSLHIIQTTTQVRTLAVFEPEANVGTTTECVSGPSIVYTKQQDGLYLPLENEDQTSIPAKEDFIVYAVVDKPSDATERDATTSRVLAVGMDGSLKWSVDVLGRIEGNPVVGKTGIYVTHNFDGYGSLSILKIQPNDGTATVAATAGVFAGEERRNIPFGPPALRKSALSEDENSSDDVVIVAEKWESGFSESQGGLYMLSLISDENEKEDDEATETSDEYQFVPISAWSYSASAPPLVHGESIFMGAAGGIIGGFTGDRKSDLSGITSGKADRIDPRWEYQVSPNPGNASQPIQSQPVIDSEGEFLCFAGVDSDFYCLQSDNGRQMWRAEAGSQILAQPHVFEGEDFRKVVYAIETQNGRVHQYDLFNGRRYWDYSCSDISNGMCQDAVEAEFAITPSGNTIYYGDIYGRINSVQVANFETKSPTVAPTSAATGNPTGKPTIASSPTGDGISTQVPEEAEDKPGLIIIDGGDAEQQIQQDGGSGNNDSSEVVEGTTSSNAGTSIMVDQQVAKGDSNKLAAYIGAAVAGLCVLMIPIIIFSMLRRRRKKSASSKEQVVVEIVDDCSSDDLEHQGGLEYYDSIGTNNGDGIEVEIINHYNPTKKKKRNKRKESLPETPNTVNNSADSIEEMSQASSAMLMVGKQHDVADPSVEAVNLMQSFDQMARRNIENGIKNRDSLSDGNYLSDDDVPPPPPLQEEAPSSPSTKEWSWGSLLKVGTAQSSEKPNGASHISLKKPSENLESKQSAPVSSPSQEQSSDSISTESPKEPSTDERPLSQKESILPLKKLKWRKKNKKNPSSSSLQPEKDSSLQPEKDSSPQSEEDSSPQPEKDSSLQPEKDLSPQPEKDSSPQPEKDSSLQPEKDSSLQPEKDLAESDKDETPALVDQKEAQALSNEELDGETIPDQPLDNSNECDETEETNDEVIAIATQYVIKQQKSPPHTPTGASAYSKLSGALQSLSPVQSVQSIQENLFSSPNHSSTKSVGSDDESLYTSYTSNTAEKLGVGASEKKQDAKDLSPFSSYAYDQDFRRRDRSEIKNEHKSFLSQPVLSKAGIGEEEHPDDERSMAPGSRYLSEETKGPKYGRSARSNRDSNSFSNSGAGNGHTSIAQMYDQLAAIGQQRREERKPVFKRRNKRMEQENQTPPSQQQEEQQGDTWGSFLDELAEAEKQFYSPSASKSKSIKNSGSSEETEDGKLA